MTTQSVPNDTNNDVWRTATWLLPFVFQIALAALAGLAWLVGKFAVTAHVLNLIGVAIIATAILAVVGWWLLRAKTPKSRARAYSVFGAAAALLIASVILYTAWR